MSCHLLTTQRSTSRANLNTLFHNANEDIKNVSLWLQSNKLFLNITKTNYMLFSANSNLKKPDNLSLYVNNVEISYVTSKGHGPTKYVKFLGIMLGDNLTWQYHISMLCSKISYSLYVLNKIKNILLAYTLRTLYYTFVQSHLNYGIMAWGNSKSITRLQKL